MSHRVNPSEEQEIIKLMQFLRECAQGSQTVNDFTSFEITAKKLHPHLSEMDKHIFDGNFRKCRENYENQNPGLIKKAWDGALIVAPYVNAAYSIEPATSLKLAEAADRVFRFIGIDILKGVV